MNEALQHRRRKQPLFLAPDSPAMRSREAAPSSTADARLDLDVALSLLDPTDRAILLLRYQEGLDYRKIAEVVGCPMGTVASRLNRARTRLRSLLDERPTVREEKPSLAHPIVLDQAPAAK
jgi:RNA polymerase sigma-70 factor (ECF subfamily)